MLMTKENMLEIFKVISTVYPQFGVTQYKIDLWTRLMKSQNPDKVMRMVEKYVTENKFPPTIADLNEPNIDSRNSNFIEKVKRWEAEAVDKSRS